VHIGKIYGRLRQHFQSALKTDQVPWESTDKEGHRYIDVSRAPLAALHSSVAAKRRARLLQSVIENSTETVTATIPRQITARPFISTEDERRLPNKGFLSAIGLGGRDIHDAPSFQTFPLTNFAGADLVVDIQRCVSIYNPGFQIRIRIESIRRDVLAKALEKLTAGRETVDKEDQGIITSRFKGAAGEDQIKVQFKYCQMVVRESQVEVSQPQSSTGKHAIQNGSTFQVLGGSITFSSRGKEDTY